MSSLLLTPYPLPGTTGADKHLRRAYIPLPQPSPRPSPSLSIISHVVVFLFRHCCLKRGCVAPPFCSATPPPIANLFRLTDLLSRYPPIVLAFHLSTYLRVGTDYFTITAHIPHGDALIIERRGRGDRGVVVVVVVVVEEEDKETGGERYLSSSPLDMRHVPGDVVDRDGDHRGVVGRRVVGAARDAGRVRRVRRPAFAVVSASSSRSAGVVVVVVCDRSRRRASWGRGRRRRRRRRRRRPRLLPPPLWDEEEDAEEEEEEEEDA